MSEKKVPEKLPEKMSFLRKNSEKMSEKNVPKKKNVGEKCQESKEKVQDL